MELYRNESNNLHRERGPAVVTPQLIQYVTNGRLHRVDGPAVITGRGTHLYYWKGIFIEPSLWNTQDTIAATDVLKIPNAEVRRCMIEIIGLEKFIKRAKPTVLDKDEESGAILYKVDMPEDDRNEPLIAIKVIDGTALKDKDGKEYRKEYFLRVPPTMKSCKEAIAWTFSMDVKQYSALEKES